MKKRALGLDACVDERDVLAASSLRVRVAVLATGVVSLILLSPVIGNVYSSLGTASHANPVWVVVAVGCMTASFVSSWALQRLTLRVTHWSDVAAPHLAGNAVSNLLPLGSAFGSVVQLRMLTGNRIDLTRAVTSLTISGMLTTLAGLFVFPLLILLPIGDATNSDIDAVAPFGLIALVALIPLLLVILRTDRPMRWVARTVYNTLRRIPRCRPPADLADRIVSERDAVRGAIRQHRLFVVAISVGRTLGDYLALYASVLAVGLRPSPAIVLVAFLAANAAGMIPFTPGGVGFVEAGLAGTFLLAGAHEPQALAAVAIYRLVSCWLPVLAGAAAYFFSRRSAPIGRFTRTSSPVVPVRAEPAVPALARTRS